MYEDDRNDAEQGNHDAPAKWRETKEVLTEPNHPFAEGWMNNERCLISEKIDAAVENRLIGLIQRLTFVAEMPEAPRIFDVVRLIEDNRMRLAEVRQPKHCSKHS